MNDDAPDTMLDDVRKHSKSGWQTGISIGEDIDIRAFEPGLIDGSVDGPLHIFPVEIDRGLHLSERPARKSSIGRYSPRESKKTLRETQNIPQNRILEENRSGPTTQGYRY